MTTEYWILAGIGAVIVLIAALVFAVWWRKRGPLLLGQALHAVALERLHDVLVPDGMGGQIQLEHLLLTGNGFVIIDVKEFEGTIFASDRMEEWTVIGQQGRFTFPNPLGTLYDRIAALRQLVRDVPVAGHVLFAHSAAFSKGRPKDVLLPTELVELYPKPERAELERLMEAFAPHWQQVKGATEPVRAGHRPVLR